MASRSAYQKFEHPLPPATFTANGNSTIELNSIPVQQAGRIVHVTGFKFLITLIPTLAAGTLTAEEAQKIARSLSIKDGAGFQYFLGTLASLRLQDAVERGFMNCPEPDALATTEQGDLVREFNFAPPGMADPEDFVQPAPIFRGGSIVFGWGALTDPDAQVTAMTATVRAFAICELHDQVIFGTRVERFEMSINKKQVIPGEGLYTELAMCDSSSLGAIAAGDFAEVTTFCDGWNREPIHVADLEKMYHGDKNVPSGLSLVHGEPRTATDDNAKVVSGTALAAAAANVSPVIWTADGAKMSKLIYASKGNLYLNWSGTQSSAYVLGTRLVPRQTQDVGKCEALLRVALPLALGPLEPRTISKRQLSERSPRRAYFALASKVL